MLHIDIPGASHAELAAAGVVALNALEEAIGSHAQAGAVRLILSVNLGEHPSATVWFHRRRPGEVWLVDDLDSYRDEAVLIRDM